MSYNNGKSRLFIKNHSVLEDIEFTSDSDYCNVSEKRRVKKKMFEKQETKKNPTFKEKNSSKSIDRNLAAPDQTIDNTVSTTISFKGCGNSIKKVINSAKAEKAPLNIKCTSATDYCDGLNKKSVKKRKSTKLETKKNPKSKNKINYKSTEKNVVVSDQTINHLGSTIISFKESDNSIEKVITVSPINVGSFNSMNINRATEESLVNKCLNKSIKDSTVFDNTLKNDRLLSKKYNTVNKSHSSSLTSSNTHINIENKSSMTQTLKIEDNMESTQNFFEPTPERIETNNGEEYGIDGMLQLISTYTIANSKYEILLF